MKSMKLAEPIRTGCMPSDATFVRVGRNSRGEGGAAEQDEVHARHYHGDVGPGKGA